MLGVFLHQPGVRQPGGKYYDPVSISNDRNRGRIMWRVQSLGGWEIGGPRQPRAPLAQGAHLNLNLATSSYHAMITNYITMSGC